ncbi:hypothetical protein KIH27_20130 [Mycobacterium sp. M1]|uniref:DUF2510 domain-containing protein n=1 Tax=Mycolicibacter acidiphilus TaxID=2835306 RepID=A0ABS5RQV9_9MYCO|nr:hypothetical protein [Mycolicibacter acidiphilus]MBS9535896.1 hypothetical protein [Mycolicibacter acidiphilus]
MTERFNAPPGWPVPPGWSPPAGWEPDPAWPPAPVGWQFWLDDQPGYHVDHETAFSYPTVAESRPASAGGRLPLILGGIGVAVLVALAGGVALFVFGRGGTVGHVSPDDQWTETSKTLLAPAPTVLPAGAVECGVSATGTYRGAARGTDTTSCPFVENVRDALNIAGGQVPTVVDAYSPVTGKHYQMSCAMEQVITCRGGVNAVVYVYEKDAPAAAPPPSVDPLLSTQWSGHGRAMKLEPDGTGTVEFASGAGNSEKWNVTWTQQPGGLFDITAVSQISQFGDGTGIGVGTRWSARFGQERGFTVLRMVKSVEPDWEFSMCTAEAQMQSVCGA